MDDLGVLPLFLGNHHHFLFQQKLGIISPTFHPQKSPVLRRVASPGGPFPRFSALHYVAMRLLDETPQPLAERWIFWKSWWIASGKPTKNHGKSPFFSKSTAGLGLRGHFEIWNVVLPDTHRTSNTFSIWVPQCLVAGPAKPVEMSQISFSKVHQTSWKLFKFKWKIKGTP